ncbi:hypothetical protein TGRUB_431600 [Toxoplasma gondii RUB]|uniref:Uncharacterized protein n=1 Tax=Toxoplasma gondii RUB TaxID=935652 RepID=A0A086LWJ7_TOXGO|nr:hypothetical protein TGRUB_431600 [Toxoplasma gondii RUB]
MDGSGDLCFLLFAQVFQPRGNGHYPYRCRNKRTSRPRGGYIRSRSLPSSSRPSGADGNAHAESPEKIRNGECLGSDTAAIGHVVWRAIAFFLYRSPSHFVASDTTTAFQEISQHLVAVIRFLFMQ